jgi:hypothetical protein
MQTTKLFCICACIVLASACVSLSSNKKNEPPPIVNSMATDKALEAGIEFGGDTLLKVKKLLRTRNQLAKAGRGLEKNLLNNFEKMPDHRLINCVSFYIASESTEAHQVVGRLLSSDKKLHRQLAWHIATHMASQEMAKTLEEFLTKVITEDRLSGYFSPEMAEALVNNRLKDSYTILRLGLMASNNVNFVKAMIAIAPERASGDLMEYLAQAPVEELRQLTVDSVDLFSCMESLKHLQKYPVSVYHGNFPHLFYYATSRNMALAELAQEVLATYAPKHNAYVAYLFSTQPEWLQLAYIEGVRRNLTPVATSFLLEVKKNSRQQEIVDEINSMIN